jgi:hypothetical protein
MDLSDKEAVMSAVGNNGYALKCASESLRCDKEVVMAAVGNYGWSLQFASDSLQNDKEVVVRAVSNNWEALRWTTEALRYDRFFILAATVTRVCRRHRWPCIGHSGQHGGLLVACVRLRYYHLRMPT